jgi:uncharacterized metal-binding protein YceD (DUF177 family)
MGNPLRDRRPLAELSAKGQVIEIADKIGSFEGLAQIIEADLGTLDADKIPQDWRDAALTGRLEFGFADAQQRVATIEGEVSVIVDAVCQRCLGHLRLPLSAQLRLMPVSGAGQADESGEFDTWELDDDLVCPADIIEEALIMAMPLAAMHSDADECGRFEQVANDAEQTTRPFADLKSQLEENR